MMRHQRARAQLAANAAMRLRLAIVINIYVSAPLMKYFVYY